MVERLAFTRRNESLAQEEKWSKEDCDNLLSKIAFQSKIGKEQIGDYKSINEFIQDTELIGVTTIAVDTVLSGLNAFRGATKMFGKARKWASNLWSDANIFTYSKSTNKAIRESLTEAYEVAEMGQTIFDDTIRGSFTEIIGFDLNARAQDALYYNIDVYSQELEFNHGRTLWQIRHLNETYEKHCEE
ncbi:hypothetical protein G0Q06_13055 [Puniceicoccales bacterium CK1056]|uniref:Uncharacterized protein n=1 Tax=Oceanipulchritudo coccoides TaxID=2706888 RepID=A0A6B2M5I6_9BACT|nr:hypothetical protein [Oceanipulchritudo coccoides]NDV63387.1 hypothetical protein [Oceanipulchritudo coccoides]